MTTQTSEDSLTVKRGDLWIDLRATARTPDRKRILRVLAVPLPHALVCVDSDTHPARNQPPVRRIALARMVGSRARYRRIGKREAA